MNIKFTELLKIVGLVVTFILIVYIRRMGELAIFENVTWQEKGYLYFFLVPVWLWAAGTLFIRRSEKSARMFAFIAGNDNRLSLSRLQAFAWTLVIFGSFAAAIGIHTRISPMTSEQAKIHRNNADIAAKQLEISKTELDRTEAALKASRAQTAPNPEALTNAQTAFNGAQAAWNSADIKHQAAVNLANNLDWVFIPGTLLALAGIAIGSGIFSSLISNVNSEEKTACVTEIKSFNKTEEELKAIEEKDDKGKVIYPPKNKTGSIRLLQILGKDMGKTGRVRFGRGRIYSAYAPILFWRSDGSEIIVDVPWTEVKFDTLIVDTSNGKLCYEFTDNSKFDAGAAKEFGQTKPDLDKAEAALKTLKEQPTVMTADLGKAEAEVEKAKAAFTPADLRHRTANSVNMSFGNARNFYEFSDLFRDDKNPSGMDLMKFQMFGWTIVAIVVYSYIFLNDLRPDISTLPTVPDSIVLLTGLSQAGYLAGKGISNTPANPNTAS